MLYKIINAKSLLTGGVFFIMVFISGILWSSGKLGGLADAFARNASNY